MCTTARSRKFSRASATTQYNPELVQRTGSASTLATMSWTAEVDCGANQSRPPMTANATRIGPDKDRFFSEHLVSL
jgi:hypothetical protein